LNLSIVLPAIRTHNWVALVESAKEACTRYEYEFVFVGPFKPPAELQNNPQIKYIEDWGSPSRCGQRAVLEASGELFFLTVDDGTLAPDSLNQSLDLYYESNNQKAVINGRHYEGGNPVPMYIWQAGNISEFHHPSINPNWLFTLQPIMNIEHFKYLGGFDCCFEYLNHGAQDLSFRLQREGGTILHSPIEICHATHMPGFTGDHESVGRAQTEHDTPLFREIYQDVSSANRVFVDLDNWQFEPDIWDRRFDRKYSSYDDMYKCKYENSEHNKCS